MTLPLLAPELPKALPDGLLLRWATPDDAEQLAEFNMAIHSNDPANPEPFLRHWTLDLMSGVHPTTTADDFTVVVDTNNGDRIVSSLCLISQPWAYAGIPVPVGRPELVATLPDYRRRGLVRLQMGAIHARSAARGELMQVITGIPWYYRQFGYEMAVNLGGSRQFFWTRPGNESLPLEEPEPFRLRPATASDIPVLRVLYERHAASSLLTRQRPDDHWRYELETSDDRSVGRLKAEIVEDDGGRPVAYMATEQWGTAYVITELGVAVGHSWRPILLFLARQLRARAEEANRTRPKPITNISFSLGTEHAAYTALGTQLERQTRPYAYYIRVPDIPGFLRHVQPVLEARLAASVLAGHTGSLKINLYREHIELMWEQGRLTRVGSYEATSVEEGDVGFPELTFLQLLFGYRSFDELHQAYADCYPNSAEALILTNILFPKLPSHVRALN